MKKNYDGVGRFIIITKKIYDKKFKILLDIESRFLNINF